MDKLIDLSMRRDASTSAHGEDEVRAPIPIKKDTLYGDAMPQFLRHQARSRYNVHNCARSVHTVHRGCNTLSPLGYTSCNTHP